MNTKEEILEKINKLVDAYKQGLLGGEKMPEDENPGLEKSSKYNYMYFTLPMALNYQRNSYVLWECANNKLDGDIRNLFVINDFSLKKIKEYIQNNKKDFSYLGGNKICNYWLYVLEQYTDIEFVDRENITVAPDTHVIQASQKLGIISEEEANLSNVQILIADRWEKLLEGTDLKPIDVHIPMWLWSRGKFAINIL